MDDADALKAARAAVDAARSLREQMREDWGHRVEPEETLAAEVDRLEAERGRLRTRRSVSPRPTSSPTSATLGTRLRLPAKRCGSGWHGGRNSLTGARRPPMGDVPDLAALRGERVASDAEYIEQLEQLTLGLSATLADTEAERDRLRAIVEAALEVVRPMADNACDAEVLRIADLYRILAGPALDGEEATDG